MNLFKGIIILFFIGWILIIIHLLSISYHKIDLEIYTSDNIYYINNLNVTNELNDEVIKFEDIESLKEYISDITAKAVNLSEEENYVRDYYSD